MLNLFKRGMEENTSLIWNPILRQYLITAPNRMHRQEGSRECPFCEDISKGRGAPDAQVWLHPNDFPPFQPPVGEAYVVIYNRDHDRTFTQLTVQEVCFVTHLWRDLYIDLASRYVAIMIFENSGESIGQTHIIRMVRHLESLEREFETILQLAIIELAERNSV